RARRVVDRRGWQGVDRVPGRVAGDAGIDVARDEAQVRGRGLPLVRRAVRVASRLELLEVRELADVDLLGKVPANRFLERLARLEVAARERPPARAGVVSALPQEHLEAPFAHLEHDREADLRGGRVTAAKLAHEGFRPIVANLTGKVSQ